MIRKSPFSIIFGAANAWKLPANRKLAPLPGGLHLNFALIMLELVSS
ncbi:hypothetical protein JGY85_15350 [Shigella sonnei]|nr:hypothetical protein [Shigella sonnei]